MLYFLGALMRRKQVYDEFKSFFCVWQKDRLHICLIMEYNGNEIYATRYMKSLFLFGRRWIGYFRLYLTGVRYFCMRSMVSVSLPPCLRYGLHIYDNPVGVLTNNPPFPQQMFQLNNYMYLSPKILSAKIWLLMHIVEVWED